MVEEEVKLYGLRISPYCWRVTWALKLKGIEHEYIDEDIYNKSASLLELNPVYKKVPVLVHDGKPICESLVIVEYIDEIWSHHYPLLPTDPYERAVARFWLKFLDEKIPTIWKMFRAGGQELEEAKKDAIELLKTVEEHAFTSKDRKFLGGDRIGIVDIALGPAAVLWNPIERAIGAEFVGHEILPRFHAWSKNFMQDPIVNDNIPSVLKK